MHLCDLCRDLWRRYGVAAKIHIQLENRLRIAALEEDQQMLETLTRETEGAEKIRADLREEINRHERSHSAKAVWG